MRERQSHLYRGIPEFNGIQGVLGGGVAILIVVLKCWA